MDDLLLSFRPLVYSTLKHCRRFCPEPRHWSLIHDDLESTLWHSLWQHLERWRPELGMTLPAYLQTHLRQDAVDVHRRYFGRRSARSCPSRDFRARCTSLDADPEAPTAYALVAPPPPPRLTDLDGFEDLTPRQRAILADVAAGFTLAEIARRRGCSPGTVNFHKQRAVAALAARNRVSPGAAAV